MDLYLCREKLNGRNSIEYVVYCEEEIKFKIRLPCFLRKFAMTEGKERKRWIPACAGMTERDAGMT